MKRILLFNWPDKALNPNNERKVHWSVKSKAIKALRHEGFWLGVAAKLDHAPDPEAKLEFRFFPPDNRRRDLHNMPVMMKGAIDGIADAMGVDDQKFDCVWPRQFEDVKEGGYVEVTVTTVHE